MLHGRPITDHQQSALKHCAGAHLGQHLSFSIHHCHASPGQGGVKRTCNALAGHASRSYNHALLAPVHALQGICNFYGIKHVVLVWSWLLLTLQADPGIEIQ